MKNFKRFSCLLAIVLIFSLVLSFTALAHDDVRYIEDNDKIYANVPWEYELSVFSSTLCYADEEGNTISFCVGENKFAPEGITALTPDKLQAVFELVYLYENDIERINENYVKYTEIKEDKVNGYSCYYVTGNYAFSEKEVDSDFAYYFNAYVFATKENIFVVAYENFEGKTNNISDLIVAVSGIVLNGTPLNDDKAELFADHDFSDSPSFEEAVLSAQKDTINEVLEEENFVGIFIAIMVMFFIVPTVILVIIAIVLIKKYSKNKKKLKRYEITFGDFDSYSAFPQNYGGYGYNQPFNQPYQQPINTVYQQNPVNQNVPSTPNYVKNAVENLEEQQKNIPSVVEESEKSNENID